MHLLDRLTLSVLSHNNCRDILEHEMAGIGLFTCMPWVYRSRRMHTPDMQLSLAPRMRAITRLRWLMYRSLNARRLVSNSQITISINARLLFAELARDTMKVHGVIMQLPSLWSRLYNGILAFRSSRQVKSREVHRLRRENYYRTYIG